MIELVSQGRCISCDKCIAVCPTNVFDRGPDGVPVIARHGDCQTCFQCEANCPADALYVSPFTSARADGEVEEAALADGGLLGSYRARIGWGNGRKPGSLTAVGPSLDSRGRPLIS